MACFRTARNQRPVSSLRTEGGRSLPPELQRPLHDQQLRKALIRPRQDLLGAESVELAKESAAQLVVDRPAVVRIDKAQVPELAALVEVGDAWSGQGEQLPCQRVDAPRTDQGADESIQCGDELGIPRARSTNSRRAVS